MKQIYMAALAVFLLSLASCAASAQSSAPRSQGSLESTKQKVSAAERNWLDAIYRRDAAAVDRSESNDLTMITGGTAVTKQEHLASMQRQVDTASNQPPASYALTNQKIIIYGDIAVVMDIASVTTSEPRPVTTPGRYWQTEIWRNEAGNWKLIHAHVSPIPRRE